MQLAIVDNRGVSRQDRRFHRGAIAVREDPIQRDLNDVPEIQLNFVVPQGVKEAVERFLQFGFEVSYDADDLVHGSLVQRTMWSVYEQTNVFVKLDVRRERHEALLSFGGFLR